MKPRLSRIYVLSVFAVLAFAGSTLAQDSGVLDIEVSDERDRIDREKIIYSPGEADAKYALKPINPVRDSATATQPAAQSTKVAVQPKSKATAEKNPPAAQKQPSEKDRESDDDSILTFNFLYYIIEKYKLQDIVD